MSEFLAIVGPTIIDGCGGAPIKDGVLVIDGRRITALGDASTPVPVEATRVTAAGKFLVPGFMNSSVYLFCDPPPVAALRYEGRYDELMIEAAQLALKSGVTTIFDTCGPRRYLAKARGAINDGREVGARVYFAGNMVGCGGPVSDDFYSSVRAGLFGFADELNALWEDGVGPELMSMSPDEARMALRRHAQSGIDFMKYVVTALRQDRSPLIAFSPRFQRIIVEEAQRADIPVKAFTGSVEGVHMAMDAGVDILGHVDWTGPKQALPTETVDMIVQRRMPCPILSQPEEGRAWAARLHALHGVAARNQQALLDAGALILMSTDGMVLSPNIRAHVVALDPRSPPPFESFLFDITQGHFRWMESVEKRGMKAMDALMAATRNVAQAYKVEKDLGTLEVGKIADLLILERNPLEKAANYRSIVEVIKDGRVIDRSALPSQRLLSTA
jgi:imidazolonepropionase-like amidohydrolase